MNIEIHTLRFGDAPWLQRIAPTLDAYCQRHGIPLFVWDDTVIDPQYPCPKYCEIDMMRAFLDGPSEFMLYVDADILVHPEAPIPELNPGLSMATDELHRVHDGSWRKWCREHFGVTVDVHFSYSNAGVWLCDRESAMRMLAEMQPPYIEYYQEQHQFNLWAYLAAESGMRLNRLPDEWNHSNRIPERPNPTWFLHFWGDRKEEELDAL